MVTRLPPEIHDLEDYTESQNWLIYGPTGVGKTRMIGALPDLLILATESGTIAAKRGGSKAKVWTIRHWNDLKKAYEWLANNDHPFKWVCIDSITEMQYKAIRAIMEGVVEANNTRDEDIPAKGDHFKWQLVMKRMAHDFNELPVNVIWTAQEMVRENPEGEDIILPLIEGKDYQISAHICGLMNVVAHLDHKMVKIKGKDETRLVRILTTGESPPIYAKDRYDVLDRQVVNPVLPTLVKQIDDAERGKPALANPARRTATSAKKTAASRVARKRVSA